MARAALPWSTKVLAERAGVGVNTVNRFERGQDARASSVAKLRRTLEGAGIDFIPENGGGAGVRLKKGMRGADDAAGRIQALEAKVANIPEPGAPSPQAGMNIMKKALAENELADLRHRRAKPKPAAGSSGRSREPEGE